MNKTIYFVRHGQTVANVTGQIQGPDDPLNEKGIKQAAIIASRARNLDFECIVSSDYPRAKVTAETIHFATGKPLEFSELFREYRRPSAFWGKVVHDDQAVLAGYKLMNEHFAEEGWYFSDEESFFDLKARGIQALQHLLSMKEQRIVVVTHGNFLRNLLGIMLRGETGYSPQDYIDIESTFELSNTSITVAEYKYHWRKDSQTWMIESWNDYAHLGEVK
jgi:probable phosphoglycerate mutase